MVAAVVPNVPPYDREDITPGIMHIGVGNFHRSHQAMYLDRLLRRGIAMDWGIVGVGLLPGDARMGAVLREQAFTYTLVELAGDGGVTATRIGSIIDHLHAPSDPIAVLESLASPAIRIVSLTITEGGYNTSEATGEFDGTDPEVLADARRVTPRTVFGMLAAGLRRRRERGIAPFTVVSCDNIVGNGDVTRRALVAFARLAHDDGLAEWIEGEVAFPNSMVDRITPVTGDAERALVRDLLGIEDAWPVVCEPFAQWVIEDDFPLGRPAWEEAGVQLVDDVAPFERMKLRLLNGSHQAMAYLGLLRGHTFVNEAMGDPAVVELVEHYLDEAAGTVPPVAGIDLAAYRMRLMERFGNANIRDTVERLATDATDRIPTFLLPVAQDRLRAGLASPATARAAAAWAVHSVRAVRSGGAPNDRRADRIAAAVAESGADAAGLLARCEWFGALRDDAAFVEAFEQGVREFATIDPGAGG
ncbi:mannitol 2-dehydrogenase [Microbacterium resistens]|uniref:Mannitol-1-phosphate 5-dehydrogenase n=1 Tax=Microbacterium resistens TaxID=156977 RepID=A0ABU1S9Z2_9MICO|nr:mannitol dehydrogenase family protein [Microbacterium resistens]MDR6866428.1 mannitol 2-dehydrogenase [Microbacterium resistens]